MTAVVVSRLARAAIDESFVLARLGYPDLTLLAWRQAARRQLDRSAATGGILVARDAAGRLNGLVLYSHSACIAAKSCVQIERLISFDVSSPRSVADTLISEVMRLGHLAGCDSLSLVRPCRSLADATTLVLASETSVACQMFWESGLHQAVRLPLKPARHPEGMRREAVASSAKRLLPRPPSRILIRLGWSSSTRRAPTPRWSGVMAARPGGAARSVASGSGTGRPRPSPPGYAATA